MTARRVPPATGLLVALLILCAGATAGAQARTDVVTLANGDRITGEVVRLDRGRLEFKTDDAGTLYLEWDKLVSVVTTRLVEVTTIDGTTFLGTLAPGAARQITVVSLDRVPLPMPEVTEINTIGRSFWRKLDGSIDAGFNSTRSSGVAQLNLNSETVFRRPGSQSRLTASFTQTESDDETDDRWSIEAAHLRDPWPRWFVTGVGRLESNRSLGLELRSQIGGAIGPRPIHSNRAQLAVGAGLAFNDEQGVDVDATQNLEALFAGRYSFFTYDRPRTNLDVSAQYYPSLSNTGRHRLQLDAGARREVFSDFFLTATLFYSFDNRPPNPDADHYDIGVVTSIGWSY